MTENDLVVSRNRIHLRETNVVFREHVPNKISIVEPINDAHKAESVMASKSSPVPSLPTTNLSVKSTKSSIGSSDNCYRTRSGRVV